MPYSAEKYAYLFDRDADGTNLRQDGVKNYRVRTIKAGKMLDVEIYPIWKTQVQVRRAKTKKSREAQQRQNAKNARRKLIRKINANFNENDLCITLTYKDVPPDEAQARRDVRNYLRRVREWRRRHGMPELKYVYVMEFGGKDGRRKRVHHHIIMSGMDRDEAERLWRGRGYANARRLQPDDYGLEALARYITKEPQRSKRWCVSRNLVNPHETVSDHKISMRRVARMAQDFQLAPGQILTTIFKGYALNDCQVKCSDFVAGAYIYAQLHRIDDRERGERKIERTDSDRECRAKIAV